MKALSDALNPMLVKEVRQDLQTRAFFHLFLWPPLVFALIFILFLLNIEPEKITHSWHGDGLLWSILALTLLLYLPRKAFTAFRKEEDAGGLELIQMTGLSSLSVVIGKWQSVVSQLFLFITAFLPYFIFNYLVAGGELLRNLVVLALLSLSAILVISIGVSASAARLGSGKAFSPILSIMLGGALLSSISSLAGFASSLGTSVNLLSLTNLIIFAAYFCILNLLLLLQAADSIAPSFENYALRRRILVFIPIVIMPLLMSWLSLSPGVVWFSLSPFLFFGLLAELLTPPHHNLYREPQSFLSYLRFPGWPGGLLFLGILLFPLYSIVDATLSGADMPDAWLAIFVTVVTLLIPFAVWNVGRYQKERLSFLLYLIVYAPFVVFSIVAASLDLKLLAGVFPVFVLHELTRKGLFIDQSVLIFVLAFFEFAVILSCYSQLRRAAKAKPVN